MKAYKALRNIACALILGAVSSIYTLPAAAQVTLPDTGVDVGGAVTATITALGAVVLTIVTGYFAFLLVRKGMQWGRRAFG